jgi:tetratricopeptide (TPR) repeat protein
LLRNQETNRYDLHRVVRQYAYRHLENKQEVHRRLRDHYAALTVPDKMQRLEDLVPLIELYHHTVCAGQYDLAWTFFRDRLWQTLYYQLGAYQVQIELLCALFPDGEDHPPRLDDEAHQGRATNELARSYSLTGQPRRSLPLYERVCKTLVKEGDRHYLAVVLGALATEGYLCLGRLRAAEAGLQGQIALCQEIEDPFWEAVGRQELGRLLAYLGAWKESDEQLAMSTRYWEQTEDTQGLCIDEAYRALRALLMARARKPIQAQTDALQAAQRALELANETARTGYPDQRDLVRAHWLIGAAHRINGDQEAAERHLDEALTRCRNINAIESEADILLDLARLRADAGDAKPAIRLAREARLITEHSGYVLQGADVCLFLARMALSAGNRAGAFAHAREARRLAAGDGPPGYAYKAAVEEAWGILEELALGSRRTVGAIHPTTQLSGQP